MLEAVSDRVRLLITKRRGDCFGAMLSGYAFVALAPSTEDPGAFRLIGLPLLVIGAALSAIAVAFPHRGTRTR